MRFVNQTAGTHTVIGTLRIGALAASNGSYTLSGGTLSAATEYIGSTDQVAAAGNGSFTQAGGAHTVTGAMNLGYSAGGTGTYSLQSGTLSAGSINLNSGGLLSFNGGQLQAGNLALAGTSQLIASVGHNKTLVLNSLSIANTANLDLNDNFIVVNYGAETTGATRNTIRNLLINGRNAGPGIPAPWNGNRRDHQQLCPYQWQRFPISPLVTSTTLNLPPSVLPALTPTSAGKSSLLRPSWS